MTVNPLTVLICVPSPLRTRKLTVSPIGECEDDRRRSRRFSLLLPWLIVQGFIEWDEPKASADQDSIVPSQVPKLDQITEADVTLTTEDGELLTLPNDVVFVLVGSDADLTLLHRLGVQTEPGKGGDVPIYNPETFETNVRGIYVAGHFTHSRHIKAAIDVPRQIVPLIAKELKSTTV